MDSTKKQTSVFGILLSSAAVLCAVGDGGLYWQYCVIPFLLLTVCLFFAESDNSGRFLKISLAVLSVSAVVSLILTKGDFQSGLYETEKIFIFALSCFIGACAGDARLILKTLFLSALITAFAGIISYCGLIDVSDYVYSDGSFRRLQSFFKYANTAAGCLGCGYFAFLKLFSDSKQRYFLLFGGCILTALMLTFSKACIPLFFVAGTLLIAKEKPLRKVFIIQSITSVLFSVPVMLLAKNREYLAALLLTCLCIAICGILPQKTVKDFFVPWLVLALTGTVFASMLVILRPALLSTFSARIEYMKDALSLIGDNPILGCGPGSWRVLQFGVQSSAYDVVYLHNGILQFLVENGIVFTLVFCVLIFRGIYLSYKNGNLGIAVIILLLFFHSLADFDLSFSAILIFLGLSVGFSNRKIGESEKSVTAHKCRFSVFKKVSVAVSAVFCLYMTAEFAARLSFENAYAAGNNEKAYENALILEKICPKDSALQMNFAALTENVGGRDEEIIARIEKSLELSPYDPDIYINYIKYAISADNAKELCCSYMELAPKQEYTYMILKRYINALHNDGILGDESHGEIISFIEKRRVEEEVTDRNGLLQELVSQNEGR